MNLCKISLKEIKQTLDNDCNCKQKILIVVAYLTLKSNTKSYRAAFRVIMPGGIFWSFEV